MHSSPGYLRVGYATKVGFVVLMSEISTPRFYSAFSPQCSCTGYNAGK